MLFMQTIEKLSALNTLAFSTNVEEDKGEKQSPMFPTLAKRSNEAVLSVWKKRYLRSYRSDKGIVKQTL